MDAAVVDAATWENPGSGRSGLLRAVPIGPQYQRPVAHRRRRPSKQMAGNHQWKRATPSDGPLKGNWWEMFPAIHNRTGSKS